MEATPPLLTTATALADFAETARRAGRVALDTEFVWERTYRPRLGIVQLAAGAECVIVDALALPDLSPLFPVLQDPAVTVVLHGGGQDLEIMAEMMGTPIRGVVDTQVAAAFVGYGHQAGLSALLDQVLRVRVRKDQTYTDWTQRPLKLEQLVYARLDVAHLLDLYDRLYAELDARGRRAWADEEMRLLEDPARFAPVPDAERFLGVSGWARLKPRELAVLRELAAWRERAARRANVRPGFIMNDVVLRTIAGRPPKSVEDLHGSRGVTRGTIDRHGRDVIAAVEAGLGCPREEWPVVTGRGPRQPSGLIALLRTAVQAAAVDHDIAPEVIATARDLEALGTAVAGGKPEDADLDVLRGWRRRLVGDTLLALAKGEVAIRYDPRRRELVMTETDQPATRVPVVTSTT
jgi:ribonuclease D